jgi:hypothetical protein
MELIIGSRTLALNSFNRVGGKRSAAAEIPACADDNSREIVCYTS